MIPRNNIFLNAAIAYRSGTINSIWCRLSARIIWCRLGLYTTQQGFRTGNITRYKQMLILFTVEMFSRSQKQPFFRVNLYPVATWKFCTNLGCLAYFAIYFLNRENKIIPSYYRVTIHNKDLSLLYGINKYIFAGKGIPACITCKHYVTSTERFAIHKT